MRDPVLYPFYADIDGLPGVGPKVKPVLARLIGGETLLDLIFHLPVSWIDRRNRATIDSVQVGEVATVTGIVDKLDHARNKLPARVRLRDDTGSRSWNASHPSAGCDRPSLVRTGGNGYLYCFAAN